MNPSKLPKATTINATVKDGDLKGYASELGLNIDLFNACLDSGAMASRVRANIREVESLGVAGTPTFFIDGEKIMGAESYGTFQRVIEGERLENRDLGLPRLSQF